MHQHHHHHQEIVRYNHGLITILQAIQGNEVKLSGPATRLLSRILHMFNKKLVDSFTAKVHNGKKVTSEIRVAQQIVESAISESLLPYALAEGHKAVLKFQAGVVTYKPKELGKKGRKKGLRKPTMMEFLTSVNHVFSRVCPGEEVDLKVKRAMANAAKSLCELMARQARILAGDNVVTPLHMKQVVDSVLARNMAAHANSEGTKFIFMYEKGLIHLRPDPPHHHHHHHHPHPHHPHPPPPPIESDKAQIPVKKSRKSSASPAAPKAKKSKRKN